MSNQAADHSDDRIKDIDFTQSVIVRWIIVAMLVLAVIVLPSGYRLPYGYYTTLRWAVTLSSLWMVLLVWPIRTAWKFIFICLAVLFNPIVPIYMERDIWRVFDFLAALFFAISTWSISERLHRLRR